MSKPRTIEWFVKEAGPCPQGLRWLRRQDNLEAAWEKCTRPEWLRWTLSVLDMDTEWTRAYQVYNFGSSKSLLLSQRRALCNSIRAAVPNPFKPKPRAPRKPAGAKKQEATA